MPLGPFDMTGGPFLILYGGLLMASVIAGFIIPRWLRPEGRRGAVTDADDLAYLAGGPARMAESMVTGLISEGSLVIERKKFRIHAPARHLRSGEAAIMRLSSPAPWAAITGAAHSHARITERRLIERGLLIDQATAMQLRLLQSAHYAPLFAFGVAKWQIGILRDRPVGHLTLLLLITAIFMLIRFATVDRRTRAGMAALAQARAGLDRLRRAPLAGETALAVAIFGTAALAGTPWSAFHRQRAAAASDGWSVSSDGGSDGGGCGGGGCGGCGS